MMDRSHFAVVVLGLLLSVPVAAQTPDTIPKVFGGNPSQTGQPVLLTDAPTHLPKADAQEPEAADPASFTITYTADGWSSLSGGMARGERYLDNLDLTLNLDLERLIGANGTTVFVYGLYNNGTNFTGSLTGDAQTISNIETGTQAFRLFEAWVQKDFGEKLSLRAGLYNLNSEFDVLDSATLFMGSAHGIGSDFAQSGLNGPSIFPSTALALRLQTELTDELTLRVAALDGVPGDPNHPARTVIRFGEDDGALLVGELGFTRGGTRILAGLWHYTARFEELLATAQAGSAIEARGNSGVYLRGETQLWQSPTITGRTLTGFSRLGLARGKFNLFDAFVSGGLTLSAPLASRPDDALGVAFAWARAGDGARSAALLSGGALDSGELAIELTWRAQITDWLAVQPDMQYVINPGLDPGLDDVFAVGLRAQLSWTF
jgi:porin